MKKNVIKEENDIKYDKLFKLGFKWNGQEFFLDDMNVHWTDIVCLEDEEFENLIETFEKRIAEQNGIET